MEAHNGVNSVKTDVVPIEIPKTILPPNLALKYPPKICVAIYP